MIYLSTILGSNIVFTNKIDKVMALSVVYYAKDKNDIKDKKKLKENKKVIFNN